MLNVISKTLVTELIWNVICKHYFSNITHLECDFYTFNNRTHLECDL